MNEVSCHDCNRPYGDKHGFPDLIIPYWAWKRISPSKDDGGLLCPSCICKRLNEAGIRCEGSFMSGPIECVPQSTMNALRRVENIELAIEGRNNSWAAVRSLVSPNEEKLPVRCPGCHHEIDPDICWCGGFMATHGCEGHSPVPMGCDCGRVLSQNMEV